MKKPLILQILVKKNGFGFVVLVICPENFLNPNLRGGCAEKFVLRKNMEKIWLNWENMAPW
jgi:hypothetical protein